MSLAKLLPKRKKSRSRRNQLSIGEILVFAVPLLFFVGLLYGTLIWTIFVSLTDWKTVAPNYDLTGFQWYQFVTQQPRFAVDIRNNFMWLILGVIPTVIIAVLLAYFLELTPFPKGER